MIKGNNTYNEHHIIQGFGIKQQGVLLLTKLQTYIIFKYLYEVAIFY